MFQLMKIHIPNDALYIKLQKAIDEAPVIPPCQVTDPDLWYPDKDEVGFQYRMAKKLCGQCPVVTMCGQYAITAGEQDGIWGGLTPKERQRMRAATARLREKSRHTEA